MGLELWGGWDSNPRPTDYESSPPATHVTAVDLGRYGSPRSWLALFGHVFGMTKLHADTLAMVVSCRGSAPSTVW